MNVSVVISTYNRAASLESTLLGLRYQIYEPFEVIVVNGPSTDRTQDLLKAWSGKLRVAQCPERHLAMSRNAGLQLAAGEIVAFIDDDAIPEPQWLCELVNAYSSEDVGGAGGIVYDPSGFRLQYKYAVCDRTGQARFNVDRPLPEHVVRGADPFIYLQGTNMSFRRRLLEQIGGFNEEFEHYFDDVEMALQVIDLGYRVQALPDAAVHHKYLASKVRDGNGVFTDPFVLVKSRFYFGLKYGCGTKTRHEVLDILNRYAQAEKDQAASHLESGRLSRAQYERCLSRIDEAIETGQHNAASERRRGREIPPLAAGDFLPFPILKPEGLRLRVCFISHDFPPEDYGGVGRYTADLAGDFARRGHEVHVITSAKGESRIDFQDGCWLHRLAPVGRWLSELEGMAITQNLLRLWIAYDEVRRIHSRAPVDLVSAPLWLCEGLICSLDDRFPTVLTLMTAMATIAGYHPSWAETDHTRQLIDLEHETFAAARHVHAISHDILRKTELTYGESSAQKFVVPLGVKDRSAEFPRRRAHYPEVPVRVLFTGRLERRKGVDLLLKAAARLLHEHNNVEFVLAGKDTVNTELGETYKAAFQREFANDRDLLARVRFTDWLSEDELMQHYADSDICCFPSRYESFGLVVVEAMSFGKPVVAFDIGGIKEIVEDGRNGFLVEPESAERLADALRRLIQNDKMRAEFGASSRDLFARRFRLDHAAGELLEVFQQIASAHRQHESATTPAPDITVEMRERLAPIIARLTGKPLSTSVEISRQLLSNDRETAQVQSDMRELWNRPDEDFVRGLYALLFGRPADPRGLKAHLGALKWGIPRLSLVQRFLQSDEASRLDSSWRTVVYESAMELAGAQSSRNGSAEHPALRSRMAMGMYNTFPALKGPAQRVSFLAQSTQRRVHKLIDYIRYWIYLPITVHDSLAELTRRSDTMTERFDSMQSSIDQSSVSLSRSIDHSIGQLRDSSIPRLDAIDAANRALAGDLHAIGEDQTKAIAAAFEQLSNLSGYIQKLPNLADDQKNLAQWVHLLQRKMETLALDLRELGNGHQKEIVEPEIVDPATYSRKLAEMGDLIRVNLGCGEKPLAGYINVDCRRIPEVDLVADVHRLPFGANSLFEIYSAHLVEHFPSYHLRRVILPYWKSLLRAGGNLRTICPNWQAMLERLNRGEMSLEDFHLVTFGGQEYETDTHFAMYTPDTFSAALTEAGYHNVQVITDQRQNGLCPEMEILAEA